jgi:DNA-binding response OmpR family regulator
VAPRRSILLLHHDAGLLDLLTRVFEARGFSVSLAATPMQARTILSSERELDVVVAAWDAAHHLGGEVYRWALEHRFELRDRFVFVGDEVAADFDRVVAGRCLVVPTNETSEIIRVAEATARRARQRPTTPPPSGSGRPRLLLADDDPALLAVMTELLTATGYDVTPVDSGNAATSALDTSDYDVILCDWHMAAGSGGHVFNWVVTFRPWLLDRIVFLTERPSDGAERIVQGRPVFPKGADSARLIETLKTIAPPRP